jgi:hypothetical protein
MQKNVTFCKLLLIFLFISCNTLPIYQDIQPDINELLNVSKEAAEMFYYYKELDPNKENIFVGSNEIGGQCEDYALAFVNIWNEKNPGQARLVVQQQRWSNGNIPNGIYRVVRKINENSMPSSFRFWIRQQNTSKMFYWTVNDNTILGIWHPVLGIYEIRLFRSLKITYHFGVELKKNHVWAVVGNIHIDPQWGDTSGKNYFISYNTW